MDFKTIKHKLYRGHFDHYNTIDEFVDDVLLVFTNCLAYNRPNSQLGMVASGLKQKFTEFMIMLLPEFKINEYSNVDETAAGKFSNSISNSSDSSSVRSKRNSSRSPSQNSSTSSSASLATLADNEKYSYRKQKKSYGSNEASN